MTSRPLIKWAGGKTRLLPQLLTRVPSSIRIYVEPFAGGAALFFALASETPRRYQYAILGDRNEELVALYRAVRDDVEAVIAALGAFKNELDFFLEVRAQVTKGMTNTARAARFLFLNRTCFNGLWRVNGKGQFNVPFGKYKNPKFLDPDCLRAGALALEGVEIRCCDFGEITATLGEGDFAYLDPPYLASSPTSSFSAYAVGGYGTSEHARLAEEMKGFAKRGVKALLSNADVSAARKLYEGLQIDSIRAPRSIAANGSRGDVGELLVIAAG